MDLWFAGTGGAGRCRIGSDAITMAYRFAARYLPDEVVYDRQMVPRPMPVDPEVVA